MKIDGITLNEGSEIVNLTVAAGSSFPTSPNDGELFYLNSGSIGLYVYQSGSWIDISGGSSLGFTDLTNVTITSAADGDVVVFNASATQWINSTLAGAGIAPTIHSHTDLTFAGYFSKTPNNTLYGTNASTLFVGGDHNRGGVSGSNNSYSTIVNAAYSGAALDYDVIVGGYYNSALGPYSFIGGGSANLTSGSATTLCGGLNNKMYGSDNRFSTIGGGHNNTLGSAGVTAICLTIGGGFGNNLRSAGDYSTIVGGSGNKIKSGVSNFIGGGSNCSLDGNYSVTIGGQSCTASGNNTFVGGGYISKVYSDYGVVVGGNSCTSNGTNDVVVGGAYCTASGGHSFVGGGDHNTVSDGYSVIAGGFHNSTTNSSTTTYYSVIAGGYYNNITDSPYGTICGGRSNNITSGYYNGIFSGYTNTLSGSVSTLVGGASNIVSADYAFLGGGRNNTVSGSAALVVGGTGNINNSDSSVIVGGAGNHISTNTAQYSFIGGGEAHQLLGNDNTGTVISGGSGNIVGSAGATARHCTISGGYYNNMAGAGNYCNIDGGIYNYIYSGLGVTIGGGKDNHAAGNYTVIAGGQSNSAAGANAFIGGGYKNLLVNSANGVVCGGYQVTSLGTNKAVFMGGGQGNIAGSAGIAAHYGVLVGGAYNTVNGGHYNSLVGGTYNTIVSSYGSIIGGRGNQVSHNYATTFGGAGDTRADFDVIISATASSTPSVNNNTIRLEGTGGNIHMDGSVTTPEADYAEYFEWADLNPNNEDRVGYFVSLNASGMLVIDNSNTIGIVSATPSVVGDAAENHWKQMYDTDVWGRKIIDTYTVHTWIDSNNTIKEVFEATDSTLYDEYPQPSNVSGTIHASALPTNNVTTSVLSAARVNPTFDPSQSYIPRSERPEWDAIGMMGKLYVRASNVTTSKVSVSPSGKAIDGSTYNVISVINASIIQILFK